MEEKVIRFFSRYDANVFWMREAWLALYEYIIFGLVCASCFVFLCAVCGVVVVLGVQVG
jgi:hypothetical protein